MKNIIKIALPIIPILVVFALVLVLGGNTVPSVDTLTENDHIVYLQEKINQPLEEGNFEAISNNFFDISNKIMLSHRSEFISDDECNDLMIALCHSYIPTWAEFAKDSFTGKKLWNNYNVSVVLRDCNIMRPYLTSEHGSDYDTFANIDVIVSSYDRVQNYLKTNQVKSLSDLQQLVDAANKCRSIDCLSSCTELTEPLFKNMNTLGRINYNLLIDYVNGMQPGMENLSQNIDSARIYVDEYKTNANKLFGEVINLTDIENRLNVLSQGGTKKLAALPHIRVSNNTAVTPARERNPQPPKNEDRTGLRKRKKTNILDTEGLFQ